MPLTGAQPPFGHVARRSASSGPLKCGRRSKPADRCSNTVKWVTLYITNAGFFPTINQVYRKSFASLTDGSWRFEADVEVEAIAVVASAPTMPNSSWPGL